MTKFGKFAFAFLAVMAMASLPAMADDFFISHRPRPTAVPDAGSTWLLLTAGATSLAFMAQKVRGIRNR